MFYLFTVIFAAAIITLSNFLLSGDTSLPSLGKALLITVICIAAVFIIDGVMAFIIRRLPEGWFSPEARAFTVGRWERNLYRKTKIGVWKKHVPEWGCFTGFHKDRLREPNDSEYVGRFLIESNYGVLGHFAGAILGFAIMLIPPLRPLTIALPVAAINMILSLLPTMVLRSNTPALRGLYRRNLQKEQTKQTQQTQQKQQTKLTQQKATKEEVGSK